MILLEILYLQATTEWLERRERAERNEENDGDRNNVMAASQSVSSGYLASARILCYRQWQEQPSVLLC